MFLNFFGTLNFSMKIKRDSSILSTHLILASSEKNCFKSIILDLEETDDKKISLKLNKLFPFKLAFSFLQESRNSFFFIFSGAGKGMKIGFKGKT